MSFRRPRFGGAFLVSEKREKEMRTLERRKKITKEERTQIYNKSGGRCAYCGEKINFSDMQVDHVVPLRLGGEDSIENMACSCRSCNKYKSTYTVEKFREQIEQIPGRLLRDSSTFRLAVRYGLIEIKDKDVEFWLERGEEIEKNDNSDTGTDAHSDSI